MKRNIQVGQWVSMATRILSVIVIVAVGLVAFSLFAQTRPEVAVVADLDTVRQVPVYQVQAESIRRQWLSQGTAEAMDTAQVPSRVTTVVEHIPRDMLPGRRVERGELLVQLDAADFERQRDLSQQEIESLTAELNLLDSEQRQLEKQIALDRDLLAITQEELENVQRLFENNAASRRDLDAARRQVIEAERAELMVVEALAQLPLRREQLKARIEVERNRLAMAELNVQRCGVRSPIDGFLDRVAVEEGEHVASGQVLFHIVNLDRIEVPLRVPASARQFVSLGDDVELRHAAKLGYVWHGTVERISPVDDPQSRTTTIYVVVEQEEVVAKMPHTVTLIHRESLAQERRILLPNTFVMGRIVSQEPQTHVMIPRRSIRGGRVLTVRDMQTVTRQDEQRVLGYIQATYVEPLFEVEETFEDTGIDDIQWVIVPDAIEQGTWIVLNVTASLMDGEPIFPVAVSQTQTLSPSTIATEEASQ